MARAFWLAIGWIAVALGGIGIVVPGLPTTGFMVFAASCFAKSSPRFEQWILDLPGVGPHVRAYRNGEGMPRRAKITALVMMTAAVVFAAGFAVEVLWVRIVIGAAGLIGWWFILVRVPTRAPIPDRRRDRRPVEGRSSVGSNSLETEEQMHDEDTEPVIVIRSSETPQIVEIVLNRPRRRNALTGPMAEALSSSLRTVIDDGTTTVVILRGEGGAFCSGLDLKEFAADPPADWVPTFPALWRSVHEALFDLPCVLIGGLERAAVNGGASLALACDFLVAGTSSFLQVGEIQQGMAAPMNMAWLRLRYSEAVAARVALLGDRIPGPQLVDLGLAHRVVADEDVVPAARELAEQIASHDPDGIRRIKLALRRTGPATSTTAWFDRVIEADPGGRSLRAPRAAT